MDVTAALEDKVVAVAAQGERSPRRVCRASFGNLLVGLASAPSRIQRGRAKRDAVIVATTGIDISRLQPAQQGRVLQDSTAYREKTSTSTGEEKSRSEQNMYAVQT